jgi:uncharacterized tellurite resistance protein B-like protein
MLRRLRQFMASAAGPAGQPDPASRVRLAVADLLVEIARADHDEKAVEHAAITGLIARHFKVDQAAAEELLSEARSAVDDAVSLRQFTAPLHEALSYQDKLAVVAMLWHVALEDSSLDKYEDYLIGKLADLLYVSRGDVVRLRYEAGQRPRD